jgi:hypothetical protein
MEIDLDTFLTLVYCLIDDLYRARFGPSKPRRGGHQPEMADSEVLTLMVLAQWQEASSERAFGAYVRRHWRGYFPRLLSQSAFNRRVRDLALVLDALGPVLATALSEQLVPAASYEVMDGAPVPLMRRCRGERHRLFADEAGVGRGGSDRDWYYGLRLVSLVNNQGLITGFALGPAPTDERWVADALLRWRQDPAAPPPSLEDLTPVLGESHVRGGRRGPTGPLASRWSAGSPSGLPILADRGFAGAFWRAHWQEQYQARVLTEQVYAVVADPASELASAPGCTDIVS